MMVYQRVNIVFNTVALSLVDTACDCSHQLLLAGKEIKVIGTIEWRNFVDGD